MSKVDELQQLFQDFHPELNNNRLFMEQLNRKLDAVEYIRQLQDRQIRRYKYAVLVAFLLGVLCCAVLFVFVWLMPEQTSLPDFGSERKWMMLLVENGRILILTVITLLISFCIVNVVSMVQDISNTTPRTV